MNGIIHTAVAVLCEASVVLSGSKINYEQSNSIKHEHMLWVSCVVLSRASKCIAIGCYPMQGTFQNV
jgi:hypothetical protein